MNSEKLKLVRNIVATIIMVILIIISSLLIVRNLMYRPVLVSGSSMAPTLTSHDYGYALKIDEDNVDKKVNRFDIITFAANVEGEDKMLIKRVIGLPGETIYFDDHADLYVNDSLIKQDFISTSLKEKSLITAYYAPYEKIIISNDYYFVLGDNRNNSYDSLHGLGEVNKQAINGVLKAIVGTCNGEGEDANEVCQDKSFSGITLY